MRDKLIEYDAIALGEFIRKGEIKPSELLVIHKMYDQAYQTIENWSNVFQHICFF